MNPSEAISPGVISVQSTTEATVEQARSELQQRMPTSRKALKLDTSYLDLFWKLASFLEHDRFQAIISMREHLETLRLQAKAGLTIFKKTTQRRQFYEAEDFRSLYHSMNDQNADALSEVPNFIRTLDYTLCRLIHGLSSQRDMAHLGFAAALELLLKEYLAYTSWENILAALESSSRQARGNERDLYGISRGKIFAYSVFNRAGFFQQSESTNHLLGLIAELIGPSPVNSQCPFLAIDCLTTLLHSVPQLSAAMKASVEDLVAKQLTFLSGEKEAMLSHCAKLPSRQIALLQLALHLQSESSRVNQGLPSTMTIQMPIVRNVSELISKSIELLFHPACVCHKHFTVGTTWFSLFSCMHLAASAKELSNSDFKASLREIIARCFEKRDSKPKLPALSPRLIKYGFEIIPIYFENWRCHSLAGSSQAIAGACQLMWKQMGPCLSQILFHARAQTLHSKPELHKAAITCLTSIATIVCGQFGTASGDFALETRCTETHDHLYDRAISYLTKIGQLDQFLDGATFRQSKCPLVPTNLQSKTKDYMFATLVESFKQSPPAGMHKLTTTLLLMYLNCFDADLKPIHVLNYLFNTALRRQQVLKSPMDQVFDWLIYCAACVQVAARSRHPNQASWVAFSTQLFPPLTVMVFCSFAQVFDWQAAPDSPQEEVRVVKRYDLPPLKPCAEPRGELEALSGQTVASQRVDPNEKHPKPPTEFPNDGTTLNILILRCYTASQLSFQASFQPVASDAHRRFASQYLISQYFAWAKKFVLAVFKDFSPSSSSPQSVFESVADFYQACLRPVIEALQEAYLGSHGAGLRPEKQKPGLVLYPQGQKHFCVPAEKTISHATCQSAQLEATSPSNAPGSFVKKQSLVEGLAKSTSACVPELGSLHLSNEELLKTCLNSSHSVIDRFLRRTRSKKYRALASLPPSVKHLLQVAAICEASCNCTMILFVCVFLLEVQEAQASGEGSIPKRSSARRSLEHLLGQCERFKVLGTASKKPLTLKSKEVTSFLREISDVVLAMLMREAGTHQHSILCHSLIKACFTRSWPLVGFLSSPECIDAFLAKAFGAHADSAAANRYLGEDYSGSESDWSATEDDIEGECGQSTESGEAASDGSIATSPQKKSRTAAAAAGFNASKSLHSPEDKGDENLEGRSNIYSLKLTKNRPGLQSERTTPDLSPKIVEDGSSGFRTGLKRKACDTSESDFSNKKAKKVVLSLETANEFASTDNSDAETAASDIVCDSEHLAFLLDADDAVLEMKHLRQAGRLSARKLRQREKLTKVNQGKKLISLLKSVSSDPSAKNGKGSALKLLYILHTITTAGSLFIWVTKYRKKRASASSNSQKKATLKKPPVTAQGLLLKSMEDLLESLVKQCAQWYTTENAFTPDEPMELPAILSVFNVLWKTTNSVLGCCDFSTTKSQESAADIISLILQIESLLIINYLNFDEVELASICAQVDQGPFYDQTSKLRAQVPDFQCTGLLTFDLLPGLLYSWTRTPKPHVTHVFYWRLISLAKKHQLLFLPLLTSPLIPLSLGIKKAFIQREALAMETEIFFALRKRMLSGFKVDFSAWAFYMRHIYRQAFLFWDVHAASSNYQLQQLRNTVKGSEVKIDHLGESEILAHLYSMRYVSLSMVYKYLLYENKFRPGEDEERPRSSRRQSMSSQARGLKCLRRLLDLIHADHEDMRCTLPPEKTDGAHSGGETSSLLFAVETNEAARAGIFALKKQLRHRPQRP